MKWTHEEPGLWCAASCAHDQWSPFYWRITVTSSGRFAMSDTDAELCCTPPSPFATLQDAVAYCEAREATFCAASVASITVPETGWLIECQVAGRPYWLYGVGVAWSWTSCSTDAVRFARQCDAEEVAKILSMRDYTVTEHQWG